MSGDRPTSVPTATIKAHLQPLVDAGWGYHVIADAAGVSRGTVLNVMRQRRRTVKAGTATALLDLTWAHLAQHRDAAERTPVDGSRRRVEALWWLGYTNQQIADAAGLHDSTITRLLRGHYRTVTATTAAGVDRAFRALWDKPARATDWVSARTIRAQQAEAQRRGYVSPLAWDDIDDPDETPNLGRYEAGLGEEFDESVRVLTREGWSAARIAEHLGVSERTVVRARTRGRVA